MKKYILICVGALALVACSKNTTPKVKDAKEESIKFPNAQVEQGFALNAEHCAKCHKLKTVKDFSREQWDKILPAMAKKAKITEEQQALINDYINWELSK